MTVDTLIMLAGTFVAALPLMGFPTNWDTVLFFMAGIFIIALGIIVRRRGLKGGAGASAKTTGAFVENEPRDIPSVPVGAVEHEAH